MTIGENIKNWRELRDFTQSDLASILEVSDKTVSSWEVNRTEPKMGMVEKICKALSCKKTDIIGEEENFDSVFSYDKEIETLLTHMKQFLLSHEDITLYGVPASQEQRKLIITAMEIGTEMAAKLEKKSSQQ
ncbi:MAG: helix-turn-helix domain-containing protein [Lachnospiraceae bacterium]|nr:helix-turn-helix domain-containing protein [Lachnospiraceae bacterium]